TEASDDLLAVLDLARQINQKSSGAFDISILPMLDLYQNYHLPAQERMSILNIRRNLVNQANLQIKGRKINFLEPGMGITLDGIAKGYIVDEGTATLSKYGFERVYVEAGGDLLVKDDKAIGKPWRIGIQNPRPEITSKLVVIEAENMAVATSGDYYQPFSSDLSVHHILNPSTGLSSPELASCTVTAPNGAMADGLATACMVLGSNDAMDLLASFPACEGYFVTKDMHVRKTSGFAV
ncbi:MAG: FAD:protein FMN transferase, partial [Desulfobulbaceae bacterium]|nr:FAD:protein FMN transferase [Desulfobulbaceae bacterium]